MTEHASQNESQQQGTLHTPLNERFMHRAKEIMSMLKRGATPLTERFRKRQKEPVAAILQDAETAKRGLTRRELLRIGALSLAGMTSSAAGREVAKYAPIVKDYGDRVNEKEAAPRPYEIHQNVQTTFLDEEGEWYETTVPTFIALNDAQFNGMAIDGKDNPIPGIGYDVVRMQTTIQEITDAVTSLDPGAVIKAGRDAIPQISDRIDILYIDREQLQQTVHAASDGTMQLADDRNLVSYLGAVGDKGMVLTDISFHTLAAEPEAQQQQLQQTPESVRAYLSSRHELTADPVVFDRVVNAVVSGQLVRYHNIGSEGRDVFMNNQTERTMVGIPLVPKVQEQTPV